MRMILSARVGALLALLLLAACTNQQSKAPDQRCSPGEAYFCRCPGNVANGEQVCDANGALQECALPGGSPCPTPGGGGEGLDDDDGGYDYGKICESGEQAICPPSACGEGERGYRTCAEDGKSFEPCDCKLIDDGGGAGGNGSNMGGYHGGTGGDDTTSILSPLGFPCYTIDDCEDGLQCSEELGYCTQGCSGPDDCLVDSGTQYMYCGESPCTFDRLCMVGCYTQDDCFLSGGNCRWTVDVGFADPYPLSVCALWGWLPAPAGTCCSTDQDYCSLEDPSGTSACVELELPPDPNALCPEAECQEIGSSGDACSSF